MRLTNPFNLLWILPVAGLIILMYILRLRRRDVIVSSTWLWQQVIRDVQANAPFQKLRRNALMIIQLIAAVLLVLAVSGPYLRGMGLGGRSLALIVDCSASMGATDVRPDRLHSAIADAKKTIGGMKPGDQVMLIAAAERPVPLTGFTADRNELLRKLDGITVRQTGTRMTDAVALAAAIISSREASEIHIFSDGAYEPITGIHFGKARVRFHSAGKSAHNVGITGVDYRRNLNGDNKLELFVTVHNFDSAPRTCNIVLSSGGDIMDAHEETLAAGSEYPEIFSLPQPSNPVVVKATLEIKDDLSVDNSATLVLNPLKSVKALLISHGNPFLETGIRVDPGVVLTVAMPEDKVSTVGYDVVILDGTVPVTLPSGNYFFINCIGADCPATPLSSVENQGLLETSRAHPILHFVDFGQIHWRNIHTGNPGPGAQEIASAENGAALIAGEKGRARTLWSGFGMNISDGPFPLTVGYPIFISNALRWLAHGEDSSAWQLHAGDAVLLDAPASAGKLTIQKPDGSLQEISGAKTSAVPYDDTSQCGLYVANGANKYQRQFAVNLASYSESDIHPRPGLDTGSESAGNTGLKVAIIHDLRPWAAAFLLLLLSVEWWAFHRRVFLS